MVGLIVKESSKSFIKMDLLNSMLSGRGCAVDGSMTRNPMTAIADRVLESHIGIFSQDLSGSFTGDVQENYMIDNKQVRLHICKIYFLAKYR